MPTSPGAELVETSQGTPNRATPTFLLTEEMVPCQSSFLLVGGRASSWALLGLLLELSRSSPAAFKWREAYSDTHLLELIFLPDIACLSSIYPSPFRRHDSSISITPISLDCWYRTLFSPPVFVPDLVGLFSSFLYILVDVRSCPLILHSHFFYAPLVFHC